MIPHKLIMRLFQYGDFRMRYHLSVLDGDYPLYSESEFRGKLYGNIQSLGYISIDIRSKEDIEFDPARYILLTPNTFPGFVESVKSIIRNIYNKDTYQETKTGKLILGVDKIELCRVLYQLPNQSQMVVMEPCIIQDDADSMYEGVRIYFSRKDIFVDIPIQYMEAYLYLLQKVDFVHYTLQMLNFLDVKNNVNKLPIHNTYNRKVNFDNPTEIIKGFVERPKDDIMGDFNM